MDPSQTPRGRYAPSPTGLLHVGCARTALVAWLSIRAQDGVFVWRIEDLDPPRMVDGAAEAAMEDLAWLGLDWDEGPDAGGPFAPYVQSQRSKHYEAALRHLYEDGRLFPCSYSRKDVRELASAPHGSQRRPPYPSSLRPDTLPSGWFGAFGGRDTPDAALRFQVQPGDVAFSDRMQGRRVERVSETVGDFVLKRRDGLYAYQLAVVVDDLHMQMTEVVRGTDLLSSTGRQLQLIEALGGEPPQYAHVPLVVDADGDKLSKRRDDITLRTLRERGIRPEALCGYLGYTLGLLEAPRCCTPQELIPCFRWASIPGEPWPLPEDLEATLLRLQA